MSNHVEGLILMHGTQISTDTINNSRSSSSGNIDILAQHVSPMICGLTIKFTQCKVPES